MGLALLCPRGSPGISPADWPYYGGDHRLAAPGLLPSPLWLEVPMQLRIAVHDLDRFSLPLKVLQHEQ